MIGTPIARTEGRVGGGHRFRINVDGNGEGDLTADLRDLSMIASDSADAVCAIHVFEHFYFWDAENVLKEWQRILKPGGFVALIWNERQLDTNDFLREYERLLLKYATDYEKVRHENIDQQKLGAFFQTGYERATFANEQVLDFEGLRGRLASSSYMPSEDAPSFPALEKELFELFAKHSEKDRIKLLYDTNIYFKQY